MNSRNVIESMAWVFESMEYGMQQMTAMNDSIARMEAYMLMLVVLMYALTIFGILGFCLFYAKRRSKKLELLRRQPLKPTSNQVGNSILTNHNMTATVGNSTAANHRGASPAVQVAQKLPALGKNLPKLGASPEHAV